MRTWFTAKTGVNETADIAIYDEIGAWGIKAEDFRSALDALGPVKAIQLRLNSPGGDVFDGLAIYNMLARHPAKVNVTVDGLAASIASIIAMAGDTRDMPENAFMMIHNPSGMVMGEASDMDEVSGTLRKIGEAMVGTYARRTGQTPEKIAEMMNARTWFTAHEAVALGFADTVLPSVKLTARFDAKQIGDAPAALTDQFKAAYDPDGDGDDDVLEALGFLGYAIDNIADAVGALTGTGDADDEGATTGPAMASLRKGVKARRAVQAAVQALPSAKARQIGNPTAAAQPGNANAGGAPGKEADESPAQAVGEAAPTGQLAPTVKATPEPTAAQAEEIASLCMIAGYPDKTLGFLQSGKTPKEVRSELQMLRVDRGRGAGDVDVSARHAITGHEAQMEGWGKAIERINSRIGL